MTMANQDEALVQQIADVVMEVLAKRGMLPAAPTPAAAPGAGTACSLPHGMAAAPTNPLLKAGAERLGQNAEKPASAGACATMAGYIDHTLLKPTATDVEVRDLCQQAAQHKFASVCVNSAHVRLAKSLLDGTGVMVCTVVGFPLGAMTTEAKAYETADAVGNGADEIDMVINIGKLQSGDYKFVCDDIRAVVQAAKGRTVKVILETSYLNDEQKAFACVLCKAAGAHFVKTSTGFSGAGATPGDIELMRRIVGAEMGVKASGGIRDCDTAQQMISAGANRLGVSASVAIVQGKKSNASY
jgi:deoxyribose-phosphate aldolase